MSRDASGGSSLVADWARATVPQLTMPAGTVLFSQDEEAASLFLIDDGFVLLSRQESTGASVMVQMAGALAVLGVAPMLACAPYASTATTRTSVRLRAVPERTVREALAQNHELALKLLEQLSHDTLLHAVRCGELGCLDARERLARVLIDHAPGEVPPLLVRLSTVDLAMLVGADASHVWRLLRAFRREHLVDTIKGRIVILDVASLRRVARVPERAAVRVWLRDSSVSR
jgi:CRP-like cAMP-binding protein